MTRKIRLHNLNLIYLLEITIFISWAIAFTHNCSQEFGFVFYLNDLIKSFSVLALLNLYLESIIVYLFMNFSKTKILTRIIYKSSFYFLLVFMTSEFIFTLLFHSYFEFAMAVGGIILAINFLKMKWCRIVFKPKSIQVVQPDYFNYG